MYQPNKTEMQRYIDEMMRYHNQWTKTVNDAAQKSREQAHIRNNDAVMAATQETNNIQIDNAAQPQPPINQSPRPDIPFYPTPQPPLDFSEAAIPQQRLEQQEQQEQQEQRGQQEQNQPVPQQREENQTNTILQQNEQDTAASQPQMRENMGEIEITEESKPVDLNEVYKNYQQVFPNIGYIMVQTLTARRTFPVANAIVEISKDFIQGRHIISRQITDLSGQIEKVEVPAVSKDFANSPGNNHPYTTYTIIVKHPEYATLTFKDVPVFEGIVSWQTVDMVPLSVSNTSDEQTEFEEDETYML